MQRAELCSLEPPSHGDGYLQICLPRLLAVSCRDGNRLRVENVSGVCERAAHLFPHFSDKPKNVQRTVCCPRGSSLLRAAVEEGKGLPQSLFLSHGFQASFGEIHNYSKTMFLILKMIAIKGHVNV